MLSSCWPWPGALYPNGYGRAADETGRYRTVHRMAYEALVGPVPAGLDLDHLCRNRPCYNPAHLEPVTRAENAKRGAHGDLVTHCPRGHEYAAVNTYVDPEGHRRCRTCNRTRWRQMAQPPARPLLEEETGREPTAATPIIASETEETL